VQGPWSVINRSVQNTLATITLADVINPQFPAQFPDLGLKTVAGGGDEPRAIG
jgi:hypothetical protein